MRKDGETLTIAQCPKCKASHIYQLIINRSPVWYSCYKGSFSIEQHFTRSFTCPQTGEEYQAMVSLLESPYTIIESLQGRIILETATNERQQENEVE